MVKDLGLGVGFCHPVGPEPHGSWCMGAAQTVSKADKSSRLDITGTATSELIVFFLLLFWQDAIGLGGSVRYCEPRMGTCQQQRKV